MSVLPRCAALVNKCSLVTTQSVKSKVSNDDSGYSVIVDDEKFTVLHNDGEANSAT